MEQNIEYKIFNEYKEKIICANNKSDAIYLLEEAMLLTNDLIEKQLLKSIINNKNYETNMKLDKFKLYLDVIDIIYYYNDAEKILEDIFDIINGTAQINTLKRLIKKKPIKFTSDYESNIIRYKDCPHCKQKNASSFNTSYIICGYSNKGFDWKGCGRDWCFKCSKKLCKSWNFNTLFNKLNRYHDNKCCKVYATQINDKYPDDYCQCTNDNVNRNK